MALHYPWRAISSKMAPVDDVMMINSAIDQHLLFRLMYLTSSEELNTVAIFKPQEKGEICPSDDRHKNTSVAVERSLHLSLIGPQCLSSSYLVQSSVQRSHCGEQ